VCFGAQPKFHRYTGRTEFGTGSEWKDGRRGVVLLSEDLSQFVVFRDMSNARPRKEHVYRARWVFFRLAMVWLPSFLIPSVGLVHTALARDQQEYPGSRSEGQSEEPASTKPLASALAKYRAGFSLMQQGKLREAGEVLQSAIQLSPTFTEAHEALGIVFLRELDTAGAEREFTSALRLNPKSVDARVNLGTVLIEEKRYSEAMWEMLGVLRSNPKYVPAIGTLSFILDQLGDNAAAVVYLQAAIRSVPSSADLYVFLGSHQYEAGKYSEAIEVFRKALELNPRSDRAHYGLGLASLKKDPLNGVPEAVREFKTALRFNPRNARAHFELGALAVQENDLDAAVADLEKAIQLQPDLAEAYGELGKVYEHEGRLDDAEMAFRAAVRLEPHMTLALYHLARVLQARGSTDEAKAYFDQERQLQEQADQQPQQAILLKVEGLQAMNDGRLEVAVSAFRKALSLDPTPQRTYDLGSALLRQGSMQEAIECFRAAIRLRPSFVKAQAELAKALQGVGDPSADDEWKKAELLEIFFAPNEQKKPLSADAAIMQYNSAVSLMQRGKTAAAVKTLQAAIKLEPKLVEAHHALGVLLMRQGDRAGAKREFYTVVRLDSEFIDARNNLGALLAQEQNFPEAIWQILEVLRSNPKDVKARVNLSNILISIGDVDAALNQLQAATQLIPENALLFLHLGRAQYRAGKNEAAIGSFRRALDLDPQLGSAHCGLGEVLLALGSSSEASAEFKTALRLDRRNADAHFQLGKIALQEGSKDEATTHLREAVRLKPEYVEAHLELGKTYEQLKRPDAAEREFRAAMAFKPDMPQALYGLAHLLYKTGRTEEAKSYSDQFDKLQQRVREKDLVPKLNAEGNEFRKEGRLDAAVTSYRRALAIDPSSAEVSYNLGLVLVGQGKTDEGIKAFRLAIRLRPSLVLAQDALAVALEKLGDGSAQEEREKADLLKSFVPSVTDQMTSN
jgi:tetratricopeptide (TPR) repeat protein